MCISQTFFNFKSLCKQNDAFSSLPFVRSFMQCFDKFVDKPSQLRLQRRLWFSAQFARKSIFQKIEKEKVLIIYSHLRKWMNEFETNDADADAFLDKSQEGHT